MDIIKTIYSRRSIRCFKSDPIDRNILTEILEAAAKSPSATNAQPWSITVVTGEKLEQIKQGNLKMLSSGVEPNPDVLMKPPEGIYQQRREILVSKLMELMGIAREDKDSRLKWTEAGLLFFNAPVVLILSADKSLDESRTQFDMGIITQSICLAAVKYNLGTCIQRQGVYFPDSLRQVTNIPESQRTTIAIPIGSPDWDSPANSLESEREPLDSFVTWHGFD